MPRYALIIEYEGSQFIGWQRQANGNSVQGTLEKALRQLDPDASDVTAAGRTDSGVHAYGQVVHCDVRRDWDAGRLCDALNAHLRSARVSVLRAASVDSGFSARFSAVRRVYLYRIIMRRAPLAHAPGLAWRVAVNLDSTAMQRASAHLIGTHDFTTFCATHCQAESPIKTLDRLTIQEIPVLYGRELHIRAEARSFLHRQIRSIVGSLERVGAGAMSADQLRDALHACDRSTCGPVAPATGLYLERVDYDPDPFRRT
ncbi:MAG: tRNA pseudouridine(38-40) synthase TruA [Rhodobacteraceae bacterium]|nr:tRNA pseudouridine(38-40) synthase TruA [Paracoccaceae bacterium]